MPIVVIKCKTEGERVLHAREIINSSEGRFFQASFIKRSTGEQRTGTFRTGVSRYTKGIGLSYNPKEHNLKGVFEINNAEGDRKEDAYRMINLSGVIYLKVNGIEYHYTPKPSGK